MPKISLPDGTRTQKKNLLQWYWDLQRRREKEKDYEKYLDAFSAAISVPVEKLKSDLSRARATIHQPQGKCGNNTERECQWAKYYVQLMKEAKSCFVFDQLAHGKDRVEVRSDHVV